jgi:hypothetical protein
MEIVSVHLYIGRFNQSTWLISIKFNIVICTKSVRWPLIDSHLSNITSDLYEYDCPAHYNIQDFTPLNSTIWPLQVIYRP